MPEQKSFAVFVMRAPKAGKNTVYTVLEIDYTQTAQDIQLAIATYINENDDSRIQPIMPGLTNYMEVAADTAQDAANQARDAGLVFKSANDMKLVRADEANTAKFGRAARPDPFADMDADPFGFGDIFKGFGGPRRG
ncbi:MAG: hypothetical protein WC043_06505 [Pseudobdellovibrionaceae bacterium]